jgi:hypothetical protein
MCSADAIMHKKLGKKRKENMRCTNCTEDIDNTALRMNFNS